MNVLRSRFGRARTATEWFAHLRRREISPSTRIQFQDWLSASPRNQAEYRRSEQLWEMLGKVTEDKQLSDEARDLLVRSRYRRRTRARSHFGLALAASFGLVALAGWWTIELRSIQVVRTAIGEQQSVTLADSSRISVNGNSYLRIDYRFGRRNIFLERGEALFEVAHNQSHPFTVHTAQAIVTAVGTEFAVARYGDRVDVDVLEGRVRAEADSDNGNKPVPVMLAAGQAGHFSAGDPSWRRGEADVARIRMWQAKRLEFQQATLATVVTEFNKVSATKIVLGDEHVAALRVSGIFRAGHTESLLGALVKLYPIEVQRDSNRIVLHFADLPPGIGHIKSAHRDPN